MDHDHDAALVVLSGGQDSTVCLAWAQSRWRRVETISFEYGQRHLIELASAAQIGELAGVPNRVVSLTCLAELGGNALCGEEEIEDEAPCAGALPNTFVPGRNLLFLTVAAAHAYRRGISQLVTGVCQADYSGYPDCREDTMRALEASLRTGMDAPFTIHTPLMHLTKAESIHLARDLGALELLAWSHSCYRGAIPPCGTCPACRLRARGFAEAETTDPLLVRLRTRR